MTLHSRVGIFGLVPTRPDNAKHFPPRMFSFTSCISSTSITLSLASFTRFLSLSSRESSPESVSVSGTMLLDDGFWTMFLPWTFCTVVFGDSRESSQLSGCSCIKGLKNMIFSGQRILQHHYYHIKQIPTCSKLTEDISTNHMVTNLFQIHLSFF